MSNRVELSAIQVNFKNSTTTCYGYQICDDYGRSIDDSLDANVMEMSDMDLLEYAFKNGNDDASCIFDYVKSEKVGMLINNEWYDFDQIEKHLQF